MKGTIDNGAEIYELIEKQLHIEPVGILPLYKNEGYMLLRYGLFQRYVPMPIPLRCLSIRMHDTKACG